MRREKLCFCLGIDSSKGCFLGPIADFVFGISSEFGYNIKVEVTVTVFVS